MMEWNECNQHPISKLIISHIGWYNQGFAVQIEVLWTYWEYSSLPQLPDIICIWYTMSYDAIQQEHIIKHKSSCIAFLIIIPWLNYIYNPLGDINRQEILKTYKLNRNNTFHMVLNCYKLNRSKKFICYLLYNFMICCLFGSLSLIQTIVS